MFEIHHHTTSNTPTGTQTQKRMQKATSEMMLHLRVPGMGTFDLPHFYFNTYL